jgi:hypothetical protein
MISTPIPIAKSPVDGGGFTRNEKRQPDSVGARTFTRVPFFTLPISSGYMQAQNPITWFGDRLRRETLEKFKWRKPRFGHRPALNYFINIERFEGNAT